MTRPVLLRLHSACRPLAVSHRRDRRSRLYHRPDGVASAGYTLVEILVATTLSLILLGAVVRMFGDVGQGITDSRAMLESADRLRLASIRLQQDLAGVTVTMDPPRRPEDNEGYFEYIEGPVGPVVAVGSVAAAVNSDVSTSTADTTVGDFDDILMFTTRSTARPFVGRFGNGTIQSDVAEVAWFLRGRTLHRRVLLVVPGMLAQLDGNNDGELQPTDELGLTGGIKFFYANYDVSARLEGAGLLPNTLGDLTRRECRFAHAALFPYTIPWSWSRGTYTFPTLPTLNECSFSGLTGMYPETTPIAPPSLSALDFWTNASGYRYESNAFIGNGVNAGTRVADDVILTNVIGFDVKAFDLAVGYVDLGSGAGSHFAAQTCTVAQGVPLTRIYDTWSTHYNYVGAPGLTGTPGLASNGFDDGGVSGIVDDDGEKLTSPPYPVPLRGIQVKIRVFEPDSRQVREVTVVQDFLPQ